MFIKVEYNQIERHYKLIDTDFEVYVNGIFPDFFNDFIDIYTSKNLDVVKNLYLYYVFYTGYNGNPLIKDDYSIYIFWENFTLSRMGFLYKADLEQYIKTQTLFM